MFKKILVPTDLSACSKRALRAAVDLASIYGGTLFVMHVKDRPDAKQYDTNTATAEELQEIELDEATIKRETRAIADAVLEQGKPELTQDRIFFRISSGNAASQILKAAEETQAEMIVIGTHGRSSLKDYFVGSTAERVAREAGCAVLVVKPDGYPYLRD